MKKLILTVFVSICFLLVLGTTKVGAAGWETVSACRSDQMSPNSIRGYIRAHDGNATAIIEGLNSKNVCVRNDISSFQVSELVGNTIYYCNENNGFVVMQNFDGGFEKTCCPIEKPIGRETKCCPADATWYNYAGVAGVPEGCSTPEGVVDEVESIARTSEPVADDIQVFTLAEERWQCPAQDCLMSLNGAVQRLLPQNISIAEPFTLAERSGYACQPQGASLTGFQDTEGNAIPADMFCAFQNAVTGPIATILASNSDIGSCLEIEGIELQRCLECLGKNIEARAAGEPESFVYSSIGCVDTRQDQFITRLFQIGLGTISGIAVIQIMWGMIERQSTDPAKIQQGRDRAIAALAALATVVGAIPILRFLGISVIQLLPNSFLG